MIRLVVLGCLPQINGLLHVDPELWPVAEQLSEPMCHVDTQRPLALTNFINRSASHSNQIGYLRLTQVGALYELDE